METSVALGPSLATLHVDLGYWLNNAGRSDEAISAIHQGMRLDPHYPEYFLLYLGAAYFESGKLEEALNAWQSYAERDPESGWAHSVLAQVNLVLGNEEIAKREIAELLDMWPHYTLTYHRGILQYKNQERTEYSVELLRQLGVPEHPPLPLPGKPSIAVLPFTNMSTDPEQEYFVDGMTDTLITDLSSIPELFVIARNTSFTYKGKAVDVKAVGRELGVKYILEGSVQRAGGRVRINAQLIDATTGGHVWSERFDRANEDIFALQDEAIGKIIAALPITRAQAETGSAVERYTENLEAFDYYLRGIRALNWLSTEGMTIALEMLAKAVELDSNFARAYAALADANARMHRWGFLRLAGGSRDVRRDGYYNAGLAVSLDPTIGQTHVALAGLQMRDRSYDEALASAEHAVSLEPNDADGHNMLAIILNAVGEHDRAYETINHAFRLNPNAPASYFPTLAWAQFQLRQYEAAIASGETFQSMVPESTAALWSVVASQAYLGNLSEAKIALDRLLADNTALSLSVLDEWMWSKRREDRDHLREGLKLAGAPRHAGGFDPDPDDMLSGEMLRQLISERTITAFVLGTRDIWWQKVQSDGTFTQGGAYGDYQGEWWIEGDSSCVLYQLSDWPQFCSVAYANQGGSREDKNEYVFVSSDGSVYPFSLEPLE